jgi:hypothetical protein
MLYFYYKGQKKELHFNEWKGINRKQSTRWQHLSQLKASALFSVQIFLIVMKHSSLYLGLVLPSGGRQSLIVFKNDTNTWFIAT